MTSCISILISFPKGNYLTLLNLKHFISGKFTIEHDLRNYTIFLKDDDPPKAYGVLGLTDEIIEILPYPLPVFVSAVLLPWKEQIICDGLILIYNVILGRGIRKDLKDTYQQAKELGIITSLDSDKQDKYI